MLPVEVENTGHSRENYLVLVLRRTESLLPSPRCSFANSSIGGGHGSDHPCGGLGVGFRDLPFAAVRGSGVDPDGVREYVPGDPLRDVRVLERVPFVMKGGAVIKDELTSAAAAPGSSSSK